MNEVRRTYSSLVNVLEVVQGVFQFAEFDEAGVLPTVHDRGFFGDTPLIIVSGWGDVEAARLLLEAGADVNAKGEGGYTPIHRAISSDNIEILDLLIKYGASVTEKNEDNDTALEHAIALRKVNSVRFISEHISSARKNET